MSNEQTDIIESLFMRALDLSHNELESLLAREVPGNTHVQNEVRELIRCHRGVGDTDDFILDQNLAANSAVNSADTQVDHGEKVHDIVGGNRLLEKIGQGGMGTVYMAAEEGDIERKVALKIVKLGMDTRQVVARFEAERQAMALFDHPNIARVFGVGATDSGRPYFVMELVRGMGIVEFAKSRNLPLEARIKLFMDICKAVEHAHQKGIIHRDLKPSNVMVTLIDGEPTVKVIDFGISKALHQQLTDKTLFTRYGAMMGTPQYMSPEQAELSGQNVDTRCDIYSLGVLLYELITGTTPIQWETLQGLTPPELHQTLVSASYPTPSKQLKQLRLVPLDGKGSHPTISPGKVQRELDWIVMKALSPNRRNRYSSVNELRNDLQSFLDGNPIQAMPYTTTNRIMTWLRKNRSASIVFLAFAALTVAWGGNLTVFALRLADSNDRLVDAIAESKDALNEVAEAERVQRQLANDLAIRRMFDATAIEFEQRYFIEFQQEIVAASRTITGEKPCCGLSVDNIYPDIFDFRKLNTNVDLPFERVERILETWKFEIESTKETHEQDLQRGIGHRCNENCYNLHKKLRPVAPRARVLFCRILVRDCEANLAPDHAGRIESRLLLAASLFGTAEFDEAEEVCNQLLELNSNRYVETVSNLLSEIKRARTQTNASG